MSDADVVDISLAMYHALDDIGCQQSFAPGSLSRELAYQEKESFHSPPAELHVT